MLHDSRGALRLPLHARQRQRDRGELHDVRRHRRPPPLVRHRSQLHERRRQVGALPPRLPHNRAGGDSHHIIQAAILFLTPAAAVWQVACLEDPVFPEWVRDSAEDLEKEAVNFTATLTKLNSIGSFVQDIGTVLLEFDYVEFTWEAIQ